MKIIKSPPVIKISLPRLKAKLSIRKLKTAPNEAPADGIIWFDSETGIPRLSVRVISENLTFDKQFPILLSPKGDLAPLGRAPRILKEYVCVFVRA